MIRSRVVLAVLVALSLARCGGDETPSSGRTTPPIPTPSVSALDGTITVTFTREELRTAGVSDHETCENAGTHEITFAVGRWTFKQTPLQECTAVNAASGTGSFMVAGDSVAFNEPAALGCADAYLYRFAISGNTVTFTKVTDDCEIRRVTFTLKPWQRRA